MSRKTENAGFLCINCGEAVSPIKKGTIRNHCPFCLYSLHVDVTPGDRAGTCGGLMKPEQLWHHSAKGPQIVHLCTLCGHRQKNIVAHDDDFERLLEMQG